jgi:hypothetical protein
MDATVTVLTMASQYQPNRVRSPAGGKALVSVLREVGAAEVGQEVMRQRLPQPVTDALAVLSWMRLGG